MNNYNKYTRQYFPAPASGCKWAEKNYITEPPVWCSVDLRDGNQALYSPMTIDEKIEFFEKLVEIMVEHDMAKVAADNVASKVRTNLAEYLEKGLVK